MFDFFGNGRKKSLDEMMKDLEEMLGSNYNPMGGNYIVGKSLTEKGTDENGDWTKETFTSKDGSYQITSIVRTYGSDGMRPLKRQKKETTKVESLKKELDLAVENEDFLLAIKIRDMIKDLENNKDLIDELESKLKDCIEKQDFEQAIEIREQLKKYQS